jgi:hypothetical protein
MTAGQPSEAALELTMPPNSSAALISVTLARLPLMRRDATAITASQRRGTYPMQRYIVFG